MKKNIYITLFLVAIMILSSCGKAESTDSTATIEASSEAETIQEEKTTEEITEEVVEEDYTKHGIWQHEVEANVYEYFVFLEDGTGYLIYLKDIYDITWSYSPSIKQIHVGFVEMGTGANYTVDDSNNVVLLKSTNYSFIFMGNDKDEEQKMIDEAIGSSVKI